MWEYDYDDRIKSKFKENINAMLMISLGLRNEGLEFRLKFAILVFF
jgi:hypothetical protein